MKFLIMTVPFYQIYLYIYISPFHDDYLHIGVLRLFLNMRMQPSVGSQFLARHGGISLTAWPLLVDRHSIAITEGYISHIRNIPCWLLYIPSGKLT